MDIEEYGVYKNLSETPLGKVLDLPLIYSDYYDKQRVVPLLNRVKRAVGNLQEGIDKGSDLYYECH